jgi:biopolymer transport protein ExbB
MKKNVIMMLIVMFTMNLFIGSILFAQETVAKDTQAVVKDSAAVANGAQTVENKNTTPLEKAPQMSGLEMLARKIVGSGLVDIFLQGGFAMWPILILFIWALSVVIWKLVALSYAKINISNLIEKIKPMIEKGNYKEAVIACENSRGPVSVIIAQGLLKADKGLEAVEKAIENSSALEMAYLDKGFSALGTTIALAPMFGFFGTLIGMIQAFDAIAKAGEVDPTIVADGIKVALITSAAGLAVAIPIQFFNNVFQTMVDALIIDMQIGSEKVIETLVESKGE